MTEKAIDQILKKINDEKLLFYRDKDELSFFDTKVKLNDEEIKQVIYCLPEFQKALIDTISPEYCYNVFATNYFRNGHPIIELSLTNEEKQKLFIYPALKIMQNLDNVIIYGKRTIRKINNKVEECVLYFKKTKRDETYKYQ